MKQQTLDTGTSELRGGDGNTNCLAHDYMKKEKEIGPKVVGAGQTSAVKWPSTLVLILLTG